MWSCLTINNGNGGVAYVRGGRNSRGSMLPGLCASRSLSEPIVGFAGSNWMCSCGEDMSFGVWRLGGGNYRCNGYRGLGLSCENTGPPEWSAPRLFGLEVMEIRLRRLKLGIKHETLKEVTPLPPPPSLLLQVCAVELRPPTFPTAAEALTRFHEQMVWRVGPTGTSPISHVSMGALPLTKNQQESTLSEMTHDWPKSTEQIVVKAWIQSSEEQHNFFFFLLCERKYSPRWLWNCWPNTNNYWHKQLLNQTQTTYPSFNYIY